ncbi:hypothetical protein B0T24DRAFT_208741 [Lasiosphaeria ovina]|uniref:Uncharacterized protein n=1 Tax=Lasiosphaeria ovina TaxID=92902 RepID=A0AAE0KG61_9PEZI|nr:hypothetical protein B0T24DRAFT_208741 [Lasiosphaeria ovina]
MSHLSPSNRPLSRVSLAPSDTTYHSFHEVELYEPNLVPAPAPGPAVRKSPVFPASKENDMSVAPEMSRQDSGYGSISRKDSPSSHRRMSTTSASSSAHRRRTRPCVQRSTKSGPVSYLPRNSRRQSISTRPAYQSRQSEPITFFHFPHFTTAEPPVDETEMTDNARRAPDFTGGPDCPSSSETSAYPLPPQTTHYWTSDRTRRLEYAAIDAARKGVRGWVMRHVVPDCFVPKSKRHMGFEDDRGSVVRYRLELDAEDGPEKSGKRGKGWWVSMRNFR